MSEEVSLSNLEKFKFSNLPENSKKLLLELLGYGIDAEGFVIKDGKRHVCPYTKIFVEFKSASIMPGSTIVMNTSPYTLSAYISDYLSGEALDNGSDV